MILYMRTERTGVRRAALTGAALVMVLGAWWLAEDTSSPERSTEAAAQVPVPAAQQVRVPPHGPAPLPVLVPGPVAAAPSPISAMPPRRDDEAATLPTPAPAEPQLPSTSKRAEDEPD